MQVTQKTQLSLIAPFLDKELDYKNDYVSYIEVGGNSSVTPKNNNSISSQNKKYHNYENFSVFDLQKVSLEGFVMPAYKRLELAPDYVDEIKLPNIRLKNIVMHPINRDASLLEIKAEVQRVINFFNQVKKDFENEYILLDRFASSLKKRIKVKYLYLLSDYYSDVFYFRSDLLRDIEAITLK